MVPQEAMRHYACDAPIRTPPYPTALSPVRPNPKKLNALQLRTLAILQAIARQPVFAHSPDQDGTVAIHTLPHRHGDHLHVDAVLVAARDATGLDNQNVTNALAHKGLLRHGPAGLLSLTLEGRNYQTGIDAAVLHAADH